MKAIGYIKEWFGRDQNWVWVLLFAAIVLTPFAAAHAQLATSYDAGTILDNAVTYFQGNFGTGLGVSGSSSSRSCSLSGRTGTRRCSSPSSP